MSRIDFPIHTCGIMVRLFGLPPDGRLETLRHAGDHPNFQAVPARADQCPIR